MWLVGNDFNPAFELDSRIKRRNYSSRIDLYARIDLPGVYTGFAVLTITPSAEQAKHNIKYSGQFVANIRITSPFL